ncbi:Protein of unknown function [Gryllus bimaculatus]|nr:Protein of unknown function [Gryllus bimaculatus]
MPQPPGPGGGIPPKPPPYAPPGKPGGGIPNGGGPPNNVHWILMNEQFSENKVQSTFVVRDDPGIQKALRLAELEGNGVPRSLFHVVLLE